MSGRVIAITGFRRTVSDLSRSIDFYCEALGFTHDADARASPVVDVPARSARLVLGGESIELVAPIGFERHRGGENPGDAVGDPAFQHVAIVARDVSLAMHALQRYAPAPISSGGPVRLPAASGGATAFKFRDPDGHPLELIAFADGGAGTRWEAAARAAPATQCNLGLDHSALDTLDAEASIRFYTAVLGLELGPRHLNRGPEQDALDGRPDAVVDVVSLRPAHVDGFHLELLAYASPSARRARPGGNVAEDLGDCLTMAVDDLSAVVGRWRSEADEGDGGPVDVADGTVLGRGPSGHLIRLAAASRPGSAA